MKSLQGFLSCIVTWHRFKLSLWRAFIYRCSRRFASSRNLSTTGKLGSQFDATALCPLTLCSDSFLSKLTQKSSTPRNGALMVRLYLFAGCRAMRMGTPKAATFYLATTVWPDTSNANTRISWPRMFLVLKKVQSPMWAWFSFPFEAFVHVGSLTQMRNRPGEQAGGCRCEAGQLGDWRCFQGCGHRQVCTRWWREQHDFLRESLQYPGRLISASFFLSADITLRASLRPCCFPFLKLKHFHHQGKLELTCFIKPCDFNRRTDSCSPLPTERRTCLRTYRRACREHELCHNFLLGRCNQIDDDADCKNRNRQSMILAFIDCNNRWFNRLSCQL